VRDVCPKHHRVSATIATVNGQGSLTARSVVSFGLFSSQIVRREYKDMNEDKFFEHFSPIKNHLVEDAPHGGCMFETYGQELDFVLAQPINTVWTVVEGDNDTMWYCKGWLRVNRLGYLITSVPWTADDEDVQCDMEGEQEMSEEDFESLVDEKLVLVRQEYGESIGPEEAYRLARNLVRQDQSS